MGEISARLQEKIETVPVERRLKVIVNLDRNTDWAEAVLNIEEAGLEISDQEEAIGAVFGAAAADAVNRIASVPGVTLVESDEAAAAL